MNTYNNNKDTKNQNILAQRIHQILSIDTGGGKSYAFDQHVLRNPHQNFIYVAPTSDLIDERQEKLIQIGVDPKRIKNVTWREAARAKYPTYSKKQLNQLTKYQKIKVNAHIKITIQEEIKNSVEGTGAIICITHQTYTNMNYYPKKMDEFETYIDEMPDFDQYMNVRIFQNDSVLLPLINVVDSIHEDLYEIKQNGVEINKLLDAKRYDDTTINYYGLLYSIKSPNYDVFIEKSNWDVYQNRSKKGNKQSEKPSELVELEQLEKSDTVLTSKQEQELKHLREFYEQQKYNLKLIILFNGRLLEGSNKTLMSANVESYMLTKYIAKKYKNVHFKTNDKLTGFKYTKHDLSHRDIKFVVAADRNHSKAFMRKKYDNGSTVLDAIEFNIVKHMKANNNGSIPEFGLVMNNDYSAKGLLGSLNEGTRLSVISHGLDDYQHLNNFIFLAALNRTPDHIRLLNLVGFTNEDILIDTLVQVCYQAISRGGIRKDDSNDAITIYIPNVFLAEMMIEILGSGYIEMLDKTMYEKLSTKDTNKRFKKHYNTKKIEKFHNNTKINKNNDLESSSASMSINSNIPNIVYRKRYKKWTQAISNIISKDKEKESTESCIAEQLSIEITKTTSDIDILTAENLSMARAEMYEHHVDTVRNFINLKESYNKVNDLVVGITDKEEYNTTKEQNLVYVPNSYTNEFNRASDFICTRFLTIDIDGCITREQIHSTHQLRGNAASYAIENTTTPGRLRVTYILPYPCLSIEHYNATCNFVIDMYNKAGLDASQLDPKSKSVVQNYFMSAMDTEGNHFFDKINITNKGILRSNVNPLSREILDVWMKMIEPVPAKPTKQVDLSVDREFINNSIKRYKQKIQFLSEDRYKALNDFAIMLIKTGIGEYAVLGHMHEITRFWGKHADKVESQYKSALEYLNNQ